MEIKGGQNRDRLRRRGVNREALPQTPLSHTAPSGQRGGGGLAWEGVVYDCTIVFDFILIFLWILQMRYSVLPSSTV